MLEFSRVQPIHPGTEEKPLFVLKYVKYKRQLKLTASFVLGFVFLLMLLGSKPKGIVEVFIHYYGGAFVLVLLWLFLELLFFREVRLYHDREGQRGQPLTRDKKVETEGSTPDI